jgi:murein DD-endopeptidase MepM/ murein hydrolase activator NlpD
MATPAPASASTTAVPATATAAPTTYTVVSGDTLSTIAQKYNTSVRALKKANNLTKSSLKPGQVLKLPQPKAKKSATTATTPKSTTSTQKAKSQKNYAKAQPVQDFDIPASTFASCPVPDPASVPDVPPKTHPAKTDETDTADSSAPVAQLVSPSELSADESTTPFSTVKPAAKPTTPTVIASATVKPAPAAPMPKPAPSDTATASTFATTTTPSTKSNRGFFSNLFAPTPPPSANWADKFMQQAKQLSDVGLEYDESWRPPGESHASRYLYKVTTGLELPRTASDQYYYLHLQNKAWDVPEGADGYADENYLRENLKPGDLLFWENTYRPERQPPITHVMIYLGTNEKGEWLMVGSQSSHGGLHNRRGGGPDIYVFDPHKPSGGYTTWLGLVRHKGRFCAYGRPLEADPTKLSVAAN